MSRYLLMVCAAAVSWMIVGDAEAQAVRATVLGTISDRTGAVLPGATVNVTNTETGIVQSTVADSQGRYSVTNLLPATYKVEASLSDFQTVVATASGWWSARRPLRISPSASLRCRRPSP